MSESQTVNLASQAWLSDHATKRLVAALATGTETVRFVGGCVRDAVRGEEVRDVDLATVHLPHKVTELLEAAAIEAIPTGIDHGTVTAVVEGKPFEITTLRKDVETFGRHAKVAFTDNWFEDAKRRDFTVNAIYADPDGRIFDPVDGVGDARLGLVRFIGEADERIREDYLRILRFFRLNAQFGQSELEKKSLAACVRNKAGLAKLSGERIQSEIMQLIATASTSAVLRQMNEALILNEILPELDPKRLVVLDRLIVVESQRTRDPDPVLRLAALLRGGEDAVLQMSQRLRVSNQMRDRLIRFVRAYTRDTETWRIPHKLRRSLYKLGQSTMIDVMLVRWAEDEALADHWQDLLDYAETWSRPELEIKAKDVMDLGIEAGPDVGRLLSIVEDWWIENDFPRDQAKQLEYLKKVAVLLC